MAADSRRFRECAGTSWVCVFLLVAVLLGLHLSLIASLWQVGGGG